MLAQMRDEAAVHRGFQFRASLVVHRSISALARKK
jgi:hypothetical protein